MGKKPFSAKAKREQLRQKRAASAHAGAAPLVAASASASAPQPLASPRRARAARPPPPAHRFRLVFAEDSDAARRAQRERAHEVIREGDAGLCAMDVEEVRPYPCARFAMPRRPAWTYRDTVNVVDKREMGAFREWVGRVGGGGVEEGEAYFEGNLETWRQLWRVIERSDVIVMVADVRFPALHFVPDLYHYVVEMGKGVVLALNKCDLVPSDVLLAWKNYFEGRYPGLAVAMFSSFPDAKLAPSGDNSELLSKRERRMARSKLSAWGADQLLAAVGSLDLDPRKKAYLGEWRARLDGGTDVSSDDEDGVDINFLEQTLLAAAEQKCGISAAQSAPDCQMEESAQVQTQKDAAANNDAEGKPKVQRRRRRRARNGPGCTSEVLPASSSSASIKLKSKNGGKGSKLVSRMERGVDDVPRSNFANVVRRVPHVGGDSETESNPSEVRFETDEEDAVRENMITIGIVGHPNAGKSSLINGVFRKKVVSTSKTPGHTKHLQTIFLSDSVRLCDCPGLVFPGKAPRELQILAGMYPIAQVREPYAVIKYLAERVPLVSILDLDVEIPRLEAFVEEDGYISLAGWTAWKICEAWAMKRGFRTAKAARLDVFRAANNILRLALDGRIVLATVPEGFEPDTEVPARFADEVTWDVHDDADACVVSASGRVEAVLSGDYGDSGIAEDVDGDADEEDDGADGDLEDTDEDVGEAVVSRNAFSLLEEA